MTTRRMAVASVIIALSMPWIALRAQRDASPTVPAAPPSMMMSSCEHHQEMTAALTRMEKLVAETKTSNDIAALRAALDQIGSQITKMRESQTKCSAMMEMMEKMEKMKSMPPQKDAGEHQHQ